MRAYEVMFIVKPDLTDEQIQETIERFTNLISEHGGKVEKVDRWGRRRLAYDIEKYREGFYTVVNFQSSSEAARELDRVLKIHDSILRHLITRRDEESPAPAAAQG